MVGFLVVAYSPAGAQCNESHGDGPVRVIADEPGVPIPLRLRPDDKVVVIARGVHGAVDYGRPTVDQEIRNAVGTSSAVVVMDVEAVAGNLTFESRS